MLPFRFALRLRYGLSAIPKHSRYSTNSNQFPLDFSFWPYYFSMKEQETLLAASLYKLDAAEARQSRRKRKDYWSSRATQPRDSLGPLAELFAPDDMYEFQEACIRLFHVPCTFSYSYNFKGHFDGVIHHFREMHLSSWPVEDFQGLTSILDRLYALCPTKDVQTHLLHLSSYGDILPHVDNLSASGSWILGVSLGDERILRMKAAHNERKEFSLTLPSGSVYLQRLMTPSSPQFFSLLKLRRLF